MVKRINKCINELIRSFGKNKNKDRESSINANERMIKKIEEWKKILRGEAEWIQKGVVSLRIEQAICQIFADIVTSEINIDISDEEMNRGVKESIVELNEHLQDGLGFGSFIMRPIGNQVEYITPDNFIPIEWDSSGRLIDVVLVEVIDIEDIRYYRFERHSLITGMLIITNEAYKGTKDTIGEEIKLNSLEKWQRINEKVSFPKMKKMDLGYYRNPIKNRIDYSRRGISIFESAIELIEKADRGYSFLGQRQKGIKLLGNKKVIHQRLNEYLRRIEFTVSLAYGDLNNPDILCKGMKENNVSKEKKYKMVRSIEDNLEKCLRDFIEAYVFYAAKMTTNYEVDITFKDSILNG